MTVTWFMQIAESFLCGPYLSAAIRLSRCNFAPTLIGEIWRVEPLAEMPGRAR